MIRKAGLVIPERPETGSRALRATLWRKADAASCLGQCGQTCGNRCGRNRACPRNRRGVRAPIDRLPSGYRFVQRDRVAGTERGTTGISFDGFVRAMLSPEPPLHAQVGRQGWQVGWNGSNAAVDHLFDDDRLDLLLLFLSALLPRNNALPEANQSPGVRAGSLAPETEALLRQHHAAEFAQHAAVAAEGYLPRT